MYELKEGRQMKPKTFANMVSNMMYERRWDLHWLCNKGWVPDPIGSSDFFYQLNPYTKYFELIQIQQSTIKL